MTPKLGHDPPYCLVRLDRVRRRVEEIDPTTGLQQVLEDRELRSLGVYPEHVHVDGEDLVEAPFFCGEVDQVRVLDDGRPGRDVLRIALAGPPNCRRGTVDGRDLPVTQPVTDE